MRLTAVTNRLKKETTIQSISVTRPPLLSEETLAKEIFAKESLPSPSSFSSQSQHQVQVTLERGESRWLIASISDIWQQLFQEWETDILWTSWSLRKEWEYAAPGVLISRQRKKFNKKPWWIWKLEVMSRTYVTKEENGSESLLQKSKSNQLLDQKITTSQITFLLTIFGLSTKSWFKTFVLKF